MDIKQALEIADAAIFNRFNRRLNEVERIILAGAWHKRTYEQIAAASAYSAGYLRKEAGLKLWRNLSEALGETVSKSSFQSALEQYQRNRRIFEHDPVDANFADVAPKGEPSSGIWTQQPLLESEPDIYVERSPLESVCQNTLLQPGSLVRVKAPSLMGKTLLMDRILSQLAVGGLRTVNISLKLADRRIHFSDLNRFLRWLCINISRELGVSNQIDEYWDEEGMGSKVSCSTYLEEYLLVESDRPLVLCLDDVDLLFPYPEIYEDFFGLLRSWHEIARSRSRKVWKKLRLAIVHATDVYIQLNLNQSPFNVGVPIELPEFNAAQVDSLAQRHRLTAQLDLMPLMKMVGGHPYLLAQAFEALKNHPDLSLSQLLANASTETGIYANHLRSCWLMVRDNFEMRESLARVMSAKRAVQLNSIQAHQLHSIGLIKLTGNVAVPRCQLYRQYFQTQLGAP
ncbi:MAG: hypothetical protein F6K19_11845 [Cyanothece sp. SIO1E1]|nr:hypothetical protein [Cyanothece sp. SIO1E1]